MAAKFTLPRYVRPTKLKGGIGYFWDLPTWARKTKKDPDENLPCPLSNESLGRDLLRALERGEELNCQLDEWRVLWRQAKDLTEADLAKAGIRGPTWGSVDWLVIQFKNDDAYKLKSPKTKRGYDQGLALLCAYITESGHRMGNLPAARIQEPHVDRMYSDLQWVPVLDKDGKPAIDEETGEPLRRRRLATANAAMRVARRMWNVAGRRKWGGIQKDLNPFREMDMEGTKSVTEVPTRAQYEAICAKAEEMGYPSVSLACALAFELCQREGDVIGTISRSQYKNKVIEVRQSKTGELITVPLFDEEGELFPDLVARLEAAPTRGTLLVMRDQPDRKASKAAGFPVYLPYKEDWFRHLFRKIARAAGVPDEIQFRAFRHGGLTELSDAEATDQEMMSTSGHTQAQTLRVYAQRSGRQAQNAARKRRALRTKNARLSE